MDGWDHHVTMAVEPYHQPCLLGHEGFVFVGEHCRCYDGYSAAQDMEQCVSTKRTELNPLQLPASTSIGIHIALNLHTIQPPLL